jgi:hypothetical protein
MESPPLPTADALIAHHRALNAIQVRLKALIDGIWDDGDRSSLAVPLASDEHPIPHTGDFAPGMGGEHF